MKIKVIPLTCCFKCYDADVLKIASDYFTQVVSWRSGKLEKQINEEMRRSLCKLSTLSYTPFSHHLLFKRKLRLIRNSMTSVASSRMARPSEWKVDCSADEPPCDRLHQSLFFLELAHLCLSLPAFCSVMYHSLWIFLKVQK